MHQHMNPDDWDDNSGPEAYGFGRRGGRGRVRRRGPGGHGPGGHGPGGPGGPGGRGWDRAERPDDWFGDGPGFGPGPGDFPEHPGGPSDHPDGGPGGPGGPGRPGGPGGPDGPRGPRRGGPRGPRGGRRGGPPGGHRGRHRGRAQRGDVRAAVLLLLGEEPMHGYQLMQAIADRTGDAWRPSAGAIYPTIAQLADEGLVVTSKEGGRRLATLTEAGQAHLAEHRDDLGDPFAAFAARDDGSDLRAELRGLQVAARQLAVAGEPDQLAAAAKILARAKREIYLLLAGEAGPADGRDG